MIAPALPRWVASVLADPENGVNALAPTVPRGLTDPAPPAVALYNAIDEAWIARDAPPEGITPELWVLQVNVGEELQVGGFPLASDPLEDEATVVVLLGGVTADSNNAATLAAAHRLMRAVRRCLVLAFHQLRDTGGELELEGQRYTLPAQFTVLTQEPVPGSGAIAIACVIPFLMTDTWALGATEI